jgi:PiT family inorganic phosphate transporter
MKLGVGFALILGAIIWGGWARPVAFIFIAPVIGIVLGFFIMLLTTWCLRRSTPKKVDKLFRKLQLVSAALYSLGHGTNDAQKTMGIIAGVLYTSKMMNTFAIPYWIILSCHAAIALGTLTGGWRIVKTLGMRLTKLQPVGGFCAETGGGATIVFLSLFGIPLSTTHTIAGAIVGAGSTQRRSAVRWGIARNIVWAWT